MFDTAHPYGYIAGARDAGYRTIWMESTGQWDFHLSPADETVKRVEEVPEFAWLNDSKQLTDKQRYALRPIIEREAVSWAVVEVSAQEIDERNILQCSILGMQRALDKLSVRPQHILVDGNKWKPYVPEGELLEIPADTVVHGDATYMSIAAASVLAKTYRDDYMLRLHEEYPQYGWANNKGYPTAEHYAALKQYGPTPYHRMTFNLKIKN